MSLTLRPAVSVENIDWNFQAVQAALASIDGATIQAGTVPNVAFAISYLPLAGGTLAGALEAPSITVGGDAVVTTPDLADYYTKSEADAAFATSAAATTAARGQVKQMAAVNSLALTAAGTYSAADLQAVIDKVDQLLAAARTAGLLES